MINDMAEPLIVAQQTAGIAVHATLTFTRVTLALPSVSLKLK
jgi:hypothetical protein